MWHILMSYLIDLPSLHIAATLSMPNEREAMDAFIKTLSLTTHSVLYKGNSLTLPPGLETSLASSIDFSILIDNYSLLQHC